MPAVAGAQTAMAENPYKNTCVCRGLRVVKCRAMSSPSPQRHRRRLVPALAALLVMALLAALGAPATAGADSIASKRAQARAAESHLNDLYAAEDRAVNAYDQAQSKYAGVQRRQRENRIQLRIAKANLAAARRQLAGIVVAAYKGDDPNAAMYVLGAQSFTDLVNRIDVINRTSRSEATVLHSVTVAAHQVATRQHLLHVEAIQARHLVKRRQGAEAKVKGLIASQQSLISGLNAQIRQLVQQRKAQAAAAARARAAAAAAAAQAPQPTEPSNPVTTPPVGGGPVPPASSVGAQAVQIAMGELGVPYVWGGASPAGFDCSGLTMWVYAQLGIPLGHFTGSQWDAGVHVSRDQLAPGDLVFFEPGIGHVGIYIGGDEFIHAPHTGTVVQISSLSDAWYAAEYQGAVRVTG
jgi:cell wall-associated NlpC family hydrolase